MMEPIVISEYDEVLDMIGGTFSGGRLIEDEEQKIPFLSFESDIGRHESDKGIVRAVRISEKYYVLCCSMCGRMGQPIPVEIDTFAKLRLWCGADILYPGLPGPVRRTIFFASERAKILVPDKPQDEDLSDEEIDELTSDERLAETLKAFMKRKRERKKACSESGGVELDCNEIHWDLPEIPKLVKLDDDGKRPSS